MNNQTNRIRDPKFQTITLKREYREAQSGNWEDQKDEYTYYTAGLPIQLGHKGESTPLSFYTWGFSAMIRKGDFFTDSSTNNGVEVEVLGGVTGQASVSSLTSIVKGTIFIDSGSGGTDFTNILSTDWQWQAPQFDPNNGQPIHSPTNFNFIVMRSRVISTFASFKKPIYSLDASLTVEYKF